MGIEDIFVWYQQKIGTYDKQQWETKIEQKEQRICGLTHIQMRSTKPNTELIDLDLVRGSSFTKAKPQHGFLKVARLATLRCIFLPFYGKWWIDQTSRSLFVLTLILYVSYIVNIIIYCIYVTKHNTDTEGVSCLEIIIPIVMMWIHSLIHSQIVATCPCLDGKKKEIKPRQYNRRRRSNIRQHRRLEKVKEIGRNKKDKVQKKLKFNDVVCVDEHSSSENYNRSRLHLRQNNNGVHIDDDGFESLNGNGSRTSEEEIVPMNASQNDCTTESIKSLPSQDPQSQIVLPVNDEIPSDLPATRKEEDPKTKEILNKEDENNITILPNCTYCKKSDSINQVEEKKENGVVVEDLNKENNDSDELANCTSCKKCESWVKQLDDNIQETATNMSRGSKVCSTDSESEQEPTFKTFKKPQLIKRRNSHIPTINITSTIDSTCDTEDEILSTPETRISNPLLGEATSSTNEWMGVTTNSEDCSYSSDIDDVSDARINHNLDYSSMLDSDLAPTAILNPPCAKVSCTVWEHNEIKKADLSMLDISSAIIWKVDSMPASMDYFYIGMVFSTVLALLPVFCRFSSAIPDGNTTEYYLVADMYKNVTSTLFGLSTKNCVFEAYAILADKLPGRVNVILDTALGTWPWERMIVVISLLQRWVLASAIFFLLSVAERTFKQRLSYAKLFSHLTSSRRARKSELPHFRLNKVRNIKTWLSVRSYLKKRGPQRSVDVIVSTAFIITLLLLTFLCVELLKDTVSFSQYYLEALIWCLGMGILLLRFMTLGTKINKKYRNLSVLITEQINLHLQIEQKPHKKDELTVANNVLKLAIDLLKELENPFKISGLSANPILYNVTKLVILSALSGVLSEMLGFKLKLHKIKLK